MLPRSSKSPRGVFLTGATGFVGQYLLKDAMAAGRPVAVLVRSDGRASGQSRIEGILQNWEQRLERKLMRPVVLEGCLAERNLGLSRADRLWLQRRCSTTLHSAASVTFQSSDASSEPWLTNVEGTRCLLNLCDDIGLREFHHISTAYVCGLRSGQILEAELEAEQLFGNDYERSKFEAELLVRRAKHLNVATIYRPSIVVGDSCTGHTTSFRGLYALLQLYYLYAVSNPRRELPLISSIGLTGNEGKNLVPVDWLTRVIWRLMGCKDSAGHTFHLTNPQPTRVCDIMGAVKSVVEATCGTHDNKSIGATQFIDEKIGETLDVYNPYLRSDPEFDCSKTIRFNSEDRCPPIDSERLLMLVAYAIEQRFTAPRMRVKATKAVDECLRDVVPDVSHTNVGADDWLQLELSGPGGGAWQVGFRGSTPVCLDRGMAEGTNASAYSSTETFCSLIDAQMTPIEAVARGVLVIRGKDRPIEECLQLMETLQRKLRSGSVGRRDEIPSTTKIDNKSTCAGG